MSASKRTLKSFRSIVAGDMSLASITSPVTNIQFMDNIGVQLDFTGTPTGVFEVQVSADYDQDQNGNVLNAGHWIPITFTDAPIAAGVAGDIYIDMNQLSAPWIRIVYTRTSGTGLLEARITGKEL